MPAGIDSVFVGLCGAVGYCVACANGNKRLRIKSLKRQAGPQRKQSRYLKRHQERQAQTQTHGIQELAPNADAGKLKFPRLGSILLLTKPGLHAAHIAALEKCGFFEVTVSGRRMAVRNLIGQKRFDIAVVFSRAGLPLPRGLSVAASDPWFKTIPVLAFGDSRLVGRVEATGLMIDHYLPAELSSIEFSEWVTAIWRRTRFLRELSPDTELPGKAWMLEQLNDRIVDQRPFAFLLYDIDRFKSIVDVYGWDRAGFFLKALASSLRETGLRMEPPPKLAHIGGDDFLVLCEPTQALKFARQTVLEFEQAADRLYDPVDAARGYINVPDRRGNLHRAALVTLSIGVVISGSAERRRESIDDALRVVIEMERLAKSQPGSYVAIDRRGGP